MDAAISTLVPLFRATDQLFHQALDGITREDLLRRPHADSNPLIWVAGHALTSRSGLTRIIGGEAENPWTQLFARGAKIDDKVEYPEVSEILSRWDQVSQNLMSRLNLVDDEELSKPSPFPVPTGDKTKRGAVIFLNYHETYHIGQMAYLRKWLGYSQLVG